MKKLILMGIPQHGNLGDNVIAFAEEKILKKYFPNFEIIQFPEDGLAEYINNNRNMVNDNDVILLQGGGNMGDLYSYIEDGRRCAIQTFQKNKIIIFPQTLYYKNEIEFKKSMNIHNSHNNLVIMAREEKSYNYMKKYYDKCKIYLTPDIVLTMKEVYNFKREEAILLLRSDEEKVLNEIEQNKIIELMKKMYGKYSVTDTDLHQNNINLKGKERENILIKKFEHLNKAKVIINNRLHGMIFAAITETPCVALNSYTHKIVESYKWLKDLKYIELCDDINLLEDKIKKVTSCKDRFYDNSFAENIISKILLDEIRNVIFT